MRSIVSALAIGLFLPPVVDAPRIQEVRRTWDPGSWVEVSGRRDPDGELLLNPQSLAACGRHVAVLDFEDRHFSAFDQGPRFLWRFGRQGSGPSEFRSPGSGSCDNNGRLWVPDRGNGRIMIVSRDGALLSSIPTTLSLRRLAVTSSGSTAWALTTGATELALRLDERGNQTMSVPLPPWLARYNGLQREAFISAAPDGGALVSFRWASVVLHISTNGTVDTLGRSPQPIPFPEFRAYPVAKGTATMLRIDPSAREASRGTFVVGDTINVLAVDQADSDQTIIDRYRLDGRYLGSRRLPRGVVSADAIREDMYVLIREPIPALLRLRWKPGVPRR